MGSVKAGPAARKFHFVGHSLALSGQLIGAAVGAVVGGILAVVCALTGVGAVLCIGLLLTGIGLGAALGKFLGSFIEGIESGKIKKGAETILYGPEGLNAARIKNEVECQDPIAAGAKEVFGKALPVVSPAIALGVGSHAGAFMNEGVWGIFYEPEGFAASRKDSQTSCGGKITKGIDSIILCGESIYVIHPSEITEDSAAVNWVLFGIDIVNTCLGFGALGKLTKAAKIGKIALIATQLGIKTASQILKSAGYPNAGKALDVVDNVIGIGTGIKSSKSAAETAEAVYKDILPGITGISSTGKDIYTGPDVKTNRDMEDYSRRMRRGTGRSWYETQPSLGR